jgi:hypothetical protein
MRRAIAFAALLIACQVHAVDLSGVPQNCQAPLARDMEMTNIPYLLDLGENSAKISRIENVAGVPAYEYLPGLYRIDCYITVHWDNGAVDYMYKFSMWEDRHGGLKGSYSQH